MTDGVKDKGRILALCGGVGGAKLALGLARIAAERLTVVVNTGDDFTHLGLHISPDLDTVLYTLAGVADPEKGWGRASETWNFMAALTQIGGQDWFQLGDKDLALHVERTSRLADGESLSAIARRLSRQFGVIPDIVPMTDAPVHTQVITDRGSLPFQQYFVKERCMPRVRAIEFDGAGKAALSKGFSAALRDPALEAIFVCPSNPYLSIDPLLALAGVKEGLSGAAAPVIAVSPLIEGQALKGPTAKIMTELGLEPSALSIARHYGALLNGFVVDSRDAELCGPLRAMGLEARAAPIYMKSLNDRIALAHTVLNFADRIRALGVS